MKRLKNVQRHCKHFREYRNVKDKHDYCYTCDMGPWYPDVCTPECAAKMSPETKPEDNKTN